MNRIIYKTDEGGIAVIIPSPEAIERYGIQAIAVKDVPSGKPFKIINVSEVPADRSQRDLWVVEDADLTDGVGAESNVFE